MRQTTSSQVFWAHSAQPVCATNGLAISWAIWASLHQEDTLGIFPVKPWTCSHQVAFWASDCTNLPFGPYCSRITIYQQRKNCTRMQYTASKSRRKLKLLGASAMADRISNRTIFFFHKKNSHDDDTSTIEEKK